MSIQTSARWSTRVAALFAAALVAGALSAAPAHAADAHAEQVSAQVRAGDAIVVSGTGWKTESGTKGSIIGFKLDDGGVTRTFDLDYPADTTASDAFKANKTIWGVVQADSTGAWQVELPYPTASNSDADLSSWTEGSTHNVRLLSGSLLTGDVVRTVGLDFEVTGTLDTTVTAGAVKQAYGKTAKVTVKVAPGATGKVTVKAGSTTVSGGLTGGKATLTLPAKSLALGRHTLTLTYPGVTGRFNPSTGTVQVTVVKAVPKVAVKAPQRVKRGKTVTLTVTVKATGLKPTGKVTVKLAGKTRTARLNAHSKATVKIGIAKSMAPGRKSVTVAYAGDKHLAKAKGTTKLIVTK
ncbi:MAG: Ig-like domain repeat protein [Nocardioidaceae bacterium]